MKRFPILLSAVLAGAVCFGSLSASALEIVEIEEIPDIRNPRDSVEIQIPEQSEKPAAVATPAPPKVPAYTKGVGPGVYEISSAQNADYVLDIRHCTVQDTDFGTAQIYRSLDVNQQKFRVEALSNGLFRIIARHTGEALASEGDGPDSVIATTNERADTGDIYDEQFWIIEKAEDDCCYIRTVSGQYATLADSRPYSGNPVVLSDYTGEPSQMWKFERTQINGENCADTDLVNPYGEDGPYSGIRLVLQFDTQTETLTAKELSAHISENEDHEFVLDTACLDSFIEELAKEYDKPGEEISFRNSYGDEITVYAKDESRELDRAQTKDMLENCLETNQVQFLTPVWKEKAATAKKDERGKLEDGYVEVDLENQKVFLYKDGKKLLETDCVSGNFGDPDRETPDGIYYIYYKASPDTLDGPDYSEFVNYWMPFYGNYGLHDATWRDEFGGEIYKDDGSHGCVNLPLNAARLIYDTVTIGYPVVLYR